MKKEVNNNRRTIVVGVSILLCMLLLYGLEVRQNRSLKNNYIIEEAIRVDSDEEILADEDGCNYTTTYSGGSWYCGYNANNYAYSNNNYQCKQVHGLTCSNGCYQEKVKNVNCVSCKKGYYYGYGSCTSCGKYYTSVDRNTDGKSSCKRESCPAGQGLDSSATTGCSACAAGYYSRDEDGECHSCSAGYTSNSNKSGCVRVTCPAGQGLDSSATTGCSNCAAGTYSPNNDGTCHPCAAGYTSTAGSSECTKIPDCKIKNSFVYEKVQSGKTYSGSVVVSPAKCNYSGVSVTCNSNCTVDLQPTFRGNLPGDMAILGYDVKFGTNTSQCPGPTAKFTITAGSDEFAVTTTLAKVFGTTSIGARYFSSEPPINDSSADLAGLDYYGEDCSETNGRWYCPKVYSRGCGDPGDKFNYCCSNGSGEFEWKSGQTVPDVCPTGYSVDSSKNSTTCKPSYNYCCSNGKGDNKWKTGQSSPNDCPNGYSVDTTKDATTCKPSYSYCCVKSDGDRQWKSNQATLDNCPTGYTRDETKTATTCTPSFSFCCSDGKGDNQWKTGQSSKTCPSGYKIDSSKNATTCKPSYSYCCTNGIGNYEWKSGQSSKTCQEGYSIDETKTSSTCKDVPGCYAKKNDDGIDIYQWTTNFTYGTLTNKSKDQCKNCYADASDLRQATSTSFEYSTKNKYVLNVSLEGCVPPKTINYCDPQKVDPPKKDVNADECEKDVVVNYDDGYSCVGTSFYNITCKNTLTVGFDNGNDAGKNSIGTVNSILAGEGFAFGLKLKAVKTCTATFDGTGWKTAYDIVVAERDRAANHLKRSGLSTTEKTTYESIKAEAENKIKALKQVVTDYTNHSFEFDFEEMTRFTMDYTVKGKKTTVSTSFVAASTPTGGKGTITKNGEISLGVSGLTNPYNYTWTNAASPYVGTFVFPKVYFDSKTGAISSTGDIDGGNKIYTNYYIDSKTYPMNITIDTYNGNIKVNNNKCNLKVNDKPSLIYRPIDVSNPFINNEWKKGQNWINSTYDFTKTIHDSTWSEPTQYKITLPADDIAAIKKSNKDNQNSSPYLGLCDRTSATTYDAITQKICDAIK